MTEEPAIETSPVDGRSWVKRHGWVLFGVGCVVAAAGIAGIRGAADPEPTSGGAELACEDFVTDRLKSPGTADFQGSAARPSADRWIVTGAVDSENSFGALARVDYRCVLRSSDGETWTLVDLEHSQR